MIFVLKNSKFVNMPYKIKDFNQKLNFLKEKMSFIDFVNKDGSIHKSISWLSLIVLRGKNGEIKKLRNEFIENDILFTDFIETMTGDTYKEQLDKTLETSSEDMNYFCIAAFGEKELIDPLTKKFSLWH